MINTSTLQQFNAGTKIFLSTAIINTLLQQPEKLYCKNQESKNQYVNTRLL